MPIAVDRPDGMKYILCRQGARSGNHGASGRARAGSLTNFAELPHDRRSCGAVDGSVNATTAAQLRISSVYDRVHPNSRDVAQYQPQLLTVPELNFHGRQLLDSHVRRGRAGLACILYTQPFWLRDADDSQARENSQAKHTGDANQRIGAPGSWQCGRRRLPLGLIHNRLGRRWGWSLKRNSRLFCRRLNGDNRRSFQFRLLYRLDTRYFSSANLGDCDGCALRIGELLAKIVPWIEPGPHGPRLSSRHFPKANNGFPSRLQSIIRNSQYRGQQLCFVCGKDLNDVAVRW